MSILIDGGLTVKGRSRVLVPLTRIWILVGTLLTIVMDEGRAINSTGTLKASSVLLLPETKNQSAEARIIDKIFRVRFLKNSDLIGAIGNYSSSEKFSVMM